MDESDKIKFALPRNAPSNAFSPNSSLTSPSSLNSFSKIYSPNTRKIKNISQHKFRPTPYYVPNRTRTKSENADPSSLPETSNYMSMDTSISEMSTIPIDHSLICSHNHTTSQFNKIKLVQLKKSKSLEDLRVENITTLGPASHEMEFVSNRIQKLQVHD